MLDRIGTTTARIIIAGVIGLLVIGGFAVAWADSAPPDRQLTSARGDDDAPRGSDDSQPDGDDSGRDDSPHDDSQRDDSGHGDDDSPAPTASSPAPTAAPSPAPVDISGNCDEAEHAADPECAGVVPGPSVPVPPAAPQGPAPAPSGETRSFSAGDAGTVTYRIDGSSLTLISATPAAGWRVEVEQGSGYELDLDFRSGSMRVQVDVEFEDGGIRERVRIRDDADDSRTEIENGDVTRVEAGEDD